METCEVCRFDARDWTVADLMGTLNALDPWWEELVRWVDPALLPRRPEPDAWSALEHFDRVVAPVIAETRGRRDRDVDVLARAVHDATHHLMEAGRVLHRLGAGPDRATGRVDQINVSG